MNEQECQTLLQRVEYFLSKYIHYSIRWVNPGDEFTDQSKKLLEDIQKEIKK